MSTGKKTNAARVKEGEEPARMPQQGRSRASYERMLGAAETLLVQSGHDDFTLLDVARVGNVSIGSIYLRFGSKDDLIRAVHTRLLARIEEDQNHIMNGEIAEAKTLDEFSRLFVTAYAQLLDRYSQALSAIMLRARNDAVIAERGSQCADAFCQQVQEKMLCYSAEFGRADHQRLTRNAYRFVYHTLARFLGLGSTPERGANEDWEEVKQDLAIMCAAFLRARE